jgi:two-component system response regulator HydG
MQTSAHIMLNASTLVFAFRGMWAVRGLPQERVLERQIVELLCDLTGASDGSVVLGEDNAPRAGSPYVSVPLLLRDKRVGTLSFRVENDASLEEARETLTAVANLATVALEYARQSEVLETENRLLRERLDSDTGIIGSSPALRRLLDMVGRVAARETTVLVLGESGTGKELIARAIHQQSPRREGPFVAVNCAALTDTLLESEFFGHEKGSFTGATERKKGRLEAAEGGTVFLDEVGELALGLQAKFLRALQEREIVRVGGTQSIKLDIRVIAATNRDLATEVKAGLFREDLYHRLNVVALRVPPLRERREDIPALARWFVARAAVHCKRRILGIAPEAERCLSTYHWPGNVRELENAMQRAVVLGSADEVLPEDLPESILEAAQPEELSGAYQRTVVDAKRDSIVAAYRQAGGDYKGAAKLLGIHPNYLLRLVRTLDLKDAVSGAER